MSHFLYFCITISLVLLTLSVACVFFRMLLGPSLPDRVVALDIIAMLTISLIAIYCILANHPIYLDIVIALSLITFLSTIAFAQFIEYQLSRNEEAEDE